jgi:hypothetical protein
MKIILAITFSILPSLVFATTVGNSNPLTAVQTFMSGHTQPPPQTPNDPKPLYSDCPACKNGWNGTLAEPFRMPTFNSEGQTIESPDLVQ